MTHLLECTEMAELPPLEQAERAILWTLSRIQADESFASHGMGLGTKTFALLTEAAATLTKKTVREVRETYSAK